MKKKFFLQTDRYIDDMAWPETDPDKLEDALKIADLTEEVLDRKLLSLSNGELRRVLLARMWMENPEWVYFNDLFGGLDPEYRRHLAASVVELCKRPGLNVAVRLAREDELLPEIPAFVYANKTFTQYAGELPAEVAKPKYTKKELKDYEIVILNGVKDPVLDPSTSPDSIAFGSRMTGSAQNDTEGKILFDLKNVNVQFGDTVVLKNLNWTVRRGEHWAVMGENGAGKSTLLGMLTADHPQIYKNDITLLGERPGRGLNIWDHKAKLGFFSPELALQYREDLSLQDKRVVLMARAAIRPPEVLLLDEPTQGLKGEYREKIFRLLQLLSKETTIILVSHYEEEWPPCMTHLLRMPKFSGT